MSISVELDYRECSLTFSEAPCTANGTPCYNSRATCRDVPNYTPETSTLVLRYHTGEPLLANDRPYLQSIEHTSQKLSPEGVSDLNDRINIRIIDAPSFDDDDRYDRQPQGTWWPRFLARHPYLIGQPARVIIDGETTHWEIASVSWPEDKIARISLVAPSAKISATLIPASRSGPLRLRGVIPQSASVLAGVLPSDVALGDLLAIGDELILIGGGGGDPLFGMRGQFNTDIQEHPADSQVQICLSYTNIALPTLVYNLIVEAGGSEYVDLADFEAEEAAGLSFRVLNNFVVAEPTRLSDLLSGLLLLGPMTLHWDAVANKLRPRAQTPWTTDLQTVAPEEIIQRINEGVSAPGAVLRTDLHATRVYIKYGPLNPLESELLGTSVAADLESETSEIYGRNYDRVFESPNLLLSDGILADSAALRILRRRSSPLRQPVEVKFSLVRSNSLPRIGSVVDLQLADTIQTIDGSPGMIRAQVISARMRPELGIVEFRALSYRPDTVVSPDITINLTPAPTLLPLDLFEAAGRPNLPVRVFLNMVGVRIRADELGGTSFRSVGFHPDSNITIDFGNVIPSGGFSGGGGMRGVGSLPAGAGGDAMVLGPGNYHIRGTGQIAAGGGGGAGVEVIDGLSIVVLEGGGGAGEPAGQGANSGTGGDAQLGTVGSDLIAGRGGDAGMPGQNSFVDNVLFQEGGLAGRAIRRMSGAVVVLDSTVRVFGAID